MFHRETLPANGTVAETALVDAPARLQLGLHRAKNGPFHSLSLIQQGGTLRHMR